MNNLIIQKDHGNVSVVKYIDGKAVKKYETGFTEILYIDGNEFVLEIHAPRGDNTAKKKINIPADVYYALNDLIPALNYFEGNLVDNSVTFVGTEVSKFVNKGK